MSKKLAGSLLVVFLLVLAGTSVLGQSTQPVGAAGPPHPGQPIRPQQPDLRGGTLPLPPRVCDETFQSDALGRPMKYRVLLPGAMTRPVAGSRRCTCCTA